MLIVRSKEFYSDRLSGCPLQALPFSPFQDFVVPRISKTHPATARIIPIPRNKSSIPFSPLLAQNLATKDGLVCVLAKNLLAVLLPKITFSNPITSKDAPRNLVPSAGEDKIM
jgi:hypothetical protein